MAEYQIIYWKSIPAQVIIKKSRREQVKHVLHERFEKAIDMAAMRGKAHGEEDYLQGWNKSEPMEIHIEEGEAMEMVAKKIADGLEMQYDEERLKALIKSGGESLE